MKTWFNHNKGSNNNTQKFGTLHPVKIETKYGFIDDQGNTKIKPQFISARPFSEGLSAVRKGDITADKYFRFPFLSQQKYKLGYIDREGKLVIKTLYNKGNAFSEGLALVEKSSKKAYVDNKGKSKIKINESAFGLYYQDFSDGLAAWKHGKGLKWGYVDKKGKYTINPSFYNASNFREGIAVVKFGEKSKCSFIDQTGKIVMKSNFDYSSGFHEGLAAFAMGAHSGFINSKGEIAIEPRFTSAQWFSEGYAPVEIKDSKYQLKWGYIDKDGKYIIQPRFDAVRCFIGGVAVVIVDGKYGYIDKNGEYIAKPQFDSAESFIGGLAQVMIGHAKVGTHNYKRDILRCKFAYINKNGEYVWGTREGPFFS